MQAHQGTKGRGRDRQLIGLVTPEGKNNFLWSDPLRTDLGAPVARLASPGGDLLDAFLELPVQDSSNEQTAERWKSGFDARAYRRAGTALDTIEDVVSAKIDNGLDSLLYLILINFYGIHV
jgi:hypothetical protein